MDENLSKRVRAAAIATWWTLLVAVLFGVAVGGASLAFLSHRPEVFLRLWGPDITWAMVENATMWILTAYKLFTWILLLVAVWLSMWARQLKRLSA
jgi:hypothetical protein